MSNLLGLLAGTVLYMIIGSVWYGPLFGKKWMKLVGITEKQMKTNKANMPKLYIAMFVLAFVSTFVLETIIDGLHISSWTSGMQLGLLLGIGLVAGSSLTTYLFEKRPMKLFLINYGYYVIVLAINGALLAVWR